MTTPSDTMPELPLHSHEVAPAFSSKSRPLYWSIRRELWENRSIYLAPLAAAALFLFGFLISSGRLAAQMRLALTFNPPQLGAIQQAYDLAAFLIMGATFIVAIFYCLDGLHGERRDRSILFWKSMPVSDLTTVLSKAIIPIVILPLLTFAVTVATQVMMLLISSVVLLGNGLSAATLWARLPFLQMSLTLLGHLLVVHGLYYAPFYGWMLLVSGWARRAVFLWAVLPLFAIGVVEKIAFNTSRFSSLLMSRMSGGGDGAAFSMPPSSHHAHGAALDFLISPGMWSGLLVTAAFLAIAVKVRRKREPI